MNNEIVLRRARDFYLETSQRYVAERYYERMPLNLFWREQNIPLMRDIVESANDPEAVIHRVQQTFMFSVNVESPIKERAVDWLLDEQRSREVDIFALPAEIQESAFSYPGNNVHRRDRRLTPDFLRTVNITLQIERYFTPDCRGFDVLELGGGLGHLARTMKLLQCTRSYVILDLPETLVFSYCFLSLNFPNARTLLVKDEESARAITTNDYDFAFVPTLFAELINARVYDLFVNTASLGEMPNKTIRYWMNYIQKNLEVRYLYTLNRYLNTIDPYQHSWRWEENECSVHYDRRWDIRQWELEPRFTRCPYVDTLISRYVEIAAARLKTIDDFACSERAAELLRIVQEQDWYNIHGDSAIMMRGDHILAHDLGMDGTLFKLWNVLRLQPSADGVATLLKYLDTLLAREDRKFEEQRYYEDLFFALYSEAQDSALEQTAAWLNKRMLKSTRRNPTLVESQDNYNFVDVGDGVIAVSMALGPLNLFKERLGERELPPVLFKAESLEKVREKVTELEQEIRVVPEIVDETVSFNLVKIDGRFLAVAKQLGPTELFKERLGQRELPPFLFCGATLEAARKKALECETESPPRVNLVATAGKYNLLKAGDRYIAVAESLAPVGLFQEGLRTPGLPPVLFVARSLEELKRMVEL